MVDMKPTYILMACFMLIGSLSALTYVGAVPLKEGWNVNFIGGIPLGVTENK